MGKLIPFLILLLAPFTGFAQDLEIYAVDVGFNRAGPYQVVKYDANGTNPQVYINSGLSRPQDIVFLEERGFAIVSSLGSNRINRYDIQTGAFVSTFATGIGQPTRMKIGADGLLYVLQWGGNGRVWRYDLDGNFVDEFTTIPVTNSIGMDWDSEGNLYVASFNAAHVRKFDPQGNDLGLFINTGLSGPTNIWFDANGDMIVMDWSANSIKRYNANGVFQQTMVVGLSEPEGVDFLDNGDFIMGNGGTSSVRQYTATGTFVKNFVEPGLGSLVKPNAVIIRRLNPHKDFVINAGLNDAWVNEDAPFQGIFITVFPGLGVVFVAWFTFDSVLPAANDAVFGASDHRWVTGLGTIDGNKVDLSMELTTGGAFNTSDPVPAQDPDYGTMTIEFPDCTEGTVNYDFPAASQSGTFTIKRVLDSNVALCQALAEDP